MDKLKEYVNSESSRGVPLNEIRQTLMEQGGWSDEDLDAVFKGGDFATTDEVESTVVETPELDNLNTEQPIITTEQAKEPVLEEQSINSGEGVGASSSIVKEKK